MCTVTYIPLQKRILFSSCRDENPARIRAKIPAVKQGNTRKLFYPADGAAGGTWIGMNNAGDLLILLNGGFENHTKRDDYRHSRGLIVKEMLDAEDPIFTWHQTELSNIEPFTIIAYVNDKLHQLVWTGRQKFHLHPDPSQPHIWSSWTLYASDIQNLRKLWFKTFLAEKPIPLGKDLLNFLQHDFSDPGNSFTMNRNEVVKTCSISIVEIKNESALFEYHDLLDSSSHHHVFNFDTVINKKRIHTKSLPIDLMT